MLILSRLSAIVSEFPCSKEQRPSKTWMVTEEKTRTAAVRQMGYHGV